MTIDPQDAADALATVDRTSMRAKLAIGYSEASAPLLLWGVVWIAANTLCAFFPTRAGLIWLPADVIGVIGTVLLCGRGRGERRHFWRFFGAFGAMALLVAAMLVVVRPTPGPQISAMISLLVAFLFTLSGLFAYGARFVVLGVALTAAVGAGSIFLAEHLYMWLAVVGGGALLLAGFWMRRV